MSAVIGVEASSERGRMKTDAAMVIHANGRSECMCKLLGGLVGGGTQKMPAKPQEGELARASLCLLREGPESLAAKQKERSSSLARRARLMVSKCAGREDQSDYGGLLREGSASLAAKQ